LGSPAISYSQMERQSARAKIDAFTGGDEFLTTSEAGVQAYWGSLVDEIPQLPEDVLYHSTQSFESWLWFDFRLPDGRRVVDRFLEQAPNLSPGERAYLQQVRGTAVRLYEVETVIPGASLTLRDLFTAQMCTVRERLGSQTIRRWDIVAARVVPAGASGQPEIEDIIPPLPRRSATALVEELHGELLVWREEHPSTDEVLFFEPLGPRFHQLWLQAVVAPEVPAVMMPDGEEALITRVHFRVHDTDALLVALDKARDMHREGEERIWQWCPRQRQRTETPTNLRLQGDTLILEALTKGAAARGRARIERIAGKAVSAGLATHQDLSQAMAGLSNESADSLEDSLEADEWVLEHYQRHYHRWLDEPVPALDDHTPREAARFGTLQPRLIELLKELEQLYCRSLELGQPGYDPLWMWEELGLSDVAAAPRPATHLPRLGHASMTRLVPGLGDVARGVVDRIQTRADRLIETVVGEDELRDDLSVRRFLHAHYNQAVNDGVPSDDAVADANLLGTHVEYLCNFELHHRKTFWIEESLAWMLTRTNLDIVGEALRLPFASFALVFSDRNTLRLAERLLSKQVDCTHRGRLLRVLTVYVSQLHQAKTQDLGLRLTLTFDDLSEDWPYLLRRDLRIEPHAHLDALLDSHFPGVDPESVDPMFESPLFKRLVQTSLNAILYATSAGEESHPRQAEFQTRPSVKTNAEQSSEEVYYLPGYIDIRELRQLQAVERAPGGGRLMHRFLVRGHWRRPNPSWKAQHPRWIKPYWKGPVMAALVERAYRLRAPQEDAKE
jgi:hypothetical protein